MSAPRIVETALNSPPWSKENEEAILAPYTYLKSGPSKEVLKHMAHALNHWFRVPEDQLELIIEISMALQNDSLLFDDIEDGSPLRRGKPVAHSVYGIPQTVNAASYVVILAYNNAITLRRLVETGGTRLRVLPEEILTEELLNAHRGQGLDILWRDNLRCPTEDEYIDMVKRKTGSLFNILLRLMMACATERADADLIPLGNLLGVVYQIRDDYNNLRDDKYNDSKGFAEDLSEGKFSFPVVHAIRSDESNTVVIDVLQQRPKTPTMKNVAINHMKNQSKSFDYTIDILRSLQKQIDDEVQKLGGNPQLQKLLDLLRV